MKSKNKQRLLMVAVLSFAFLVVGGSAVASLTFSANGIATDSTINLTGGNVGIGDATPASLLTVGNGDLFQVSSAGNVTLLTAPTTSASSYDILTRNSSTGVLEKIAATAFPSASGTTNYIAKFTGTNSLGNSLVFDNGTNVGIGTATPGSQLEIYKSSGAAVLALKTGSFQARIFNDGSLHVDGNGNAVYVDTGVMVINPPNATTGGLTMSYGGSGGNTRADMYINSNGRFDIRTDATTNGDALGVTAIDSRGGILLNPTAGNVGIGTTSPSTKLAVSGPDPVTFTGTNPLGIMTTMSGYGLSGIDFGNVTSNGPMARIAMESTVDGSYLRFGTTNNWASGINNTAISIDYVGNVGIGTANPLSPLTIQGNGTTATTIGAKENRIFLLNNSSTLNNGAEIVIGAADTTTGRYAAIGTSIQANTSGAAAGGVYIATKTNTADTTLVTRLYIAPNGNVGIGSVNPQAVLDVNGPGIIVEQSYTPASASATCTQGTISWDSGYVYVCVATNTWKRSALATW